MIATTEIEKAQELGYWQGATVGALGGFMAGCMFFGLIISRMF